LFAVAAVARRTESVGERVGRSRQTFRRDSMTRDSGERERERERGSPLLHTSVYVRSFWTRS
jgi:hypothetical protein